MHLAKLMVVAMVISLAAGHAMPIWEMLPRQEKMGQIMYIFMHLVDQTCSFSYIPDCQHVLALNGLTNLINMDELTLNRLDPYQAGARQLIWAQVMRGSYDLSPAYLPYYLQAEADDMTNEIDGGNPSSPHQSYSPSFLYPYSPIPNAHNKPTATVSDPHPYAVKVKPPPGFAPSSHRPSSHAKANHEEEEVGSDVASGKRFATWSDSETLVGVGGREPMDVSSTPSSESEALVGNQQLMEDVHASWSDSETVASNQRGPEDRFASWSDVSTVPADQQPVGDAFVAWSEGDALAGNPQTHEGSFVGWNDGDVAAGNQQPVEDVYATWSDIEVIGGNQQSSKDRYAGWSDSESVIGSTEGKHSTDTNSKQETEAAARYVSWSDSEAGLGDGENRMPAGIKPSADFEPVMVESRVVMSRVAPPEHSVSAATTRRRRRRNAIARPLLPLPLLRQ